MFPFRKILFPVDYSAPCEAVVPYVKEMARHFSARITLAHAYGPEALAHSNLPISDPDLPAEARKFEQQRLREYALTRFSGQPVDSFAELGEAGTVLHQLVQHQGTDLVMLATHGRGVVRRFLLGSIAAKVLHDVSAAVWTGTGAILTDHASKIAYKSILCALDDSEESEGVLRVAASLASGYEAQLSLVRVVQMPPPTEGFDLTQCRKDILDTAGDGLRTLMKQVGINVPYAVVEANVADGVREEARRQKADLVVTGRGRAQSTLRMWSHVYPVVREAPCPVLSI